METMDNQIQEDLDYILPDDYDEAEDTIEAEEDESEEETLAEDNASEEVEESEESEETEKSEPSESLDELEVKFLHEVKKLKDIPKDELKTLVQKGMNHDRIAEKFKLANEKVERLRQLSELYGMSDMDVINSLYERYYEDVADGDGLTPNQVKARVEESQRATTQKMYDRFAQKFPDVKAADIPAEVWDEVKFGEDLSKAYDNHLRQNTILAKDSEVNQLKTKLAELEGKLKTFTQNEKVKKKAVVKSTSVNGSDNVKEDDFLSALLGDD
jgi:hypothetical protein